jgi:GNAT superfamily N-acetyltransferase
MDVRAALDAFDAHLRAGPPPEEPGSVIERDGDVVRVVAPAGWSGVVWSRLSEASADGAIAGQQARFAGMEWEWKAYSTDLPADLPDRLRAAGLSAEPAETVLLADIAELDTAPAPPAGIELVDVTDAAGIAELIRLHDTVFDTDGSRLGAALLARLEAAPDTMTAVLALGPDGRAVASARVDYSPATGFAGLWGGGTLPQWRGRGIFRALVAHRARLAAARGIRYLQVDAMPMSRPILERLGFTAVATVTAWT